MSKDFLRERGNSLENQFFHEKDKQLLDQLRTEQQAKEVKQALSDASGIQDDALLTRLVELNLSVESLASMSLVPLVAVAWADGSIEQQERQAILKAASENGIREDHASYQMIQQWLSERPGAELLDAWRQYVQSLSENLQPDQLNQLKDEVLGRAQKVAASAGGFLGLNKISVEEQQVLDELRQVFE